MRLFIILTLAALVAAKPAKEVDYIDEILQQLEHLIDQEADTEVRNVIKAVSSQGTWGLAKKPDEMGDKPVKTEANGDKPETSESNSDQFDVAEDQPSNETSAETTGATDNPSETTGATDNSSETTGATDNSSETTGAADNSSKTTEDSDHSPETTEDSDNSPETTEDSDNSPETTEDSDNSPETTEDSDTPNSSPEEASTSSEAVDEDLTGETDESSGEGDNDTATIIPVPEEKYESLGELIKAKYGEEISSTPFKFLYGELLTDVVKEAVVAMLADQNDDIKELIAVRATRALLETVKTETFSRLRHVISQKVKGALTLSGALPDQDQLPEDFEALVNAIFSHLTVDVGSALERIAEIFYDDAYENVFAAVGTLQRNPSFYTLPTSEALEILKKTISESLSTYPSDGLLPPGILIEAIANSIQFLETRLSTMDEMELPGLNFTANGPRAARIMRSLQEDLQDEVNEAVDFLHALQVALLAGDDGVATFFAVIIARDAETVIKKQEASFAVLTELSRASSQLLTDVNTAVEAGQGKTVIAAILMTVAEQLYDSGFTQQETVSALTALLHASLSH